MVFILCKDIIYEPLLVLVLLHTWSSDVSSNKMAFFRCLAFVFLLYQNKYLKLKLKILNFQDVHSVSSLLKMYFRELPNPLCTYYLYDQFVEAARAPENERLVMMRDVVQQLPPPNYRYYLVL